MNPGNGLELDNGGYFSLSGRRFVPVGVNYWPGSCGVEMWQSWPEREIQHDLDVVAGLGLNCVRFFLRWQDFEPQAGQYDQRMLARLERFLSWCSERHLYAQPSLFVGWMSGGIFWPGWRERRNVFADAWMGERAVAFARRAAEVIAPFHEILLGIDQGNELCCLPDSRAAPPQAVIHWCASVNQAIRSVYPQALIVSGNEQNQVHGDTGWRFGQQPGTDYYSMHGYPVPTWHSIAFDGMTDPLCQSLLPFYVKVARAHGPVLLQEFGTILTFGAEQQDCYLRATLPACWEAGANGFLWWCLRDISASAYPYLSHAFEGTLGLVDARDQVKPGLGYFVAFARGLQERVQPAPPEAPVGIYLPRYYYPREEPLNPGNDPHQFAPWLILANYFLQRLGYATCVIRGDQPLDPALRTLIIPGLRLTADEAASLEAWVRAGGRLIWHGPDPVNWGPGYVRLLGAEPTDYRASRATEMTLFGETWTFDGYPRALCVQVLPRQARVLASDLRGVPVALQNTVGEGRVTYALPLVESSIVPLANDPPKRDRWEAWYRGVLQMA